MNTVKTYTDLITSEHSNKPDFMAMVSQIAEMFVQIQKVIGSMPLAFDVDYAIGAQLDIVGQWVGVTRNVTIPIAGVYFSFDGTDPSVGWDFGTWQGNLTPNVITVLPDDAYRTLIRARIAANQWDGTTNGAYAIWATIFPNFKILIQDYQNMTIAIGIVGGIVDSLTLALLTGGYLQLKPQGVRITDYFVAVDTNPLFAWDVESAYVAGFDVGSWAKEAAPT